ncbi:TlpA disulfide reductase family protein [Winogradskyella maritima]|uniref:TlpA family protein disulfide reductase n=1 Tax=Winogradskyella maritima TaxID=1517766 RepID=A0ABV8AEQ8_9FLAO|nr:TlpA disulfide reductase family protein [Winogradskyella maritima]
MKKLILIGLLFPLLALGQHELKGTFSPAEDFTYAFLYKMNPKDPEFVGKAELDSLGNFNIVLDENAKPGIYKIIYALPAEANNFDIIYNGKEDVNLNFSLENGVEFTSSLENKQWASYLKSMEVINNTINNYYTQNGTDKKAFQDIFKTLSETQRGYENSADGMLAKTFIKANKPYIPETYEDLKTYSDNFKANYFAHVNFDDPLLQSSTFITDRVNGFIFGLSKDSDAEAYKSHLAILAKALDGSNLDTRSTLLEMLWQTFVEKGNETMANHIAESYLIDIATEEHDLDLMQRLVTYKNTSLGNVAPDFEVIAGKQRLLELNEADQYLLVFWSSTCGHCLNELPVLHKELKAHPNLKVIAYGLEDTSENWSETIRQFPDFTHVLGLGKWENPLVKTYGIQATPYYFVLDKDKRIVAKPYDLEMLKDYLSKK